MPSTPLFPFGHGLSYTTFDYGPLELASDTVDVGGEAEASVTVTNAGDRRGLFFFLACSGAHALVPPAGHAKVLHKFKLRLSVLG